jgi:peroxiredoxin
LREYPLEGKTMQPLGRELVEGLEKRGAVLDDARRAAVLRAAEELLDSNIAMRALQAGEAMPDFALHAATGKLVRLSDVLGQGPAVVSFFRGTWCGYCQAFVRTLADAHERFRAAGAGILAISPQREGIEAASALPFPWLRDDDNAVARKVGVAFELPRDLSWAYRELGIDVPKLNQSERFELPVPATFVVGKDQRIRFAHVEPDYRRRPDLQAVLGAVQESARAI